MGDRTAHESRFAHAGKAEIAHLLAATRRNRSSSLRSTETPLRAIRQPFQEPLLNSLHVRAEFGLWARHARRVVLFLCAWPALRQWERKKPRPLQSRG